MHSLAKTRVAKMCGYKVLFIFVLGYLLSDVYAQQEHKFFRRDYTYKGTKNIEAFYKIHTLHKNWREARKTCASEGAFLFYPEDKQEADAIVTFMNETTPFYWVFIGVSDILAKGVYETIDGVPMNKIYHNWAIGEPNGLDPENCVILRHDGFILDESCDRHWPFVCKKTLDSLQWNTQCNMPNMDYEYNEDIGKCYKFHINPLTWTDAFAACSAEQSYLAVINSQTEADHMRNMTAHAPKDNIEGTI